MSTLDHRPDVSFVIAAYNAGETIGRAVASALAQTGVTMEIVIIDDCSTDGTRELVRSYAEADERVRLIAREKNGGPAAARNAGLEAARGRWIAILDSDDTIHPARLLTMLDSAKASEAQIVVDNIDVIPLEGGSPQTMFPVEELKRRPVMTLADFIGSNVIFQSTFNFGYMKPVFDREFLMRHQLRFDETLRVGEDYLLLASALASGGRCAVVPETGYVYHLRKGSISRVLEQYHLDAMLASDRGFLARYALDAEAMAAQRRRTRSIMEASAFLTLVEEIKKGSVGGFLKTAIENPRALMHLRMPIAVRMRRLAKAFRRQLKSDRIGRGRPPERTKEWI
ncbi:glycosyltransferase family 2 protein [Rhizobium puerariae]|uniref:Glycosyltransferase family 2 protein n=1 Tax=Rhizobium puerariae TaxID=1585791 RepID=A0ABV6AG05_9HYPH